MSRRRLVLEEMGIAPLWRLRGTWIDAPAGAAVAGAGVPIEPAASLLLPAPRRAVEAVDAPAPVPIPVVRDQAALPPLPGSGAAPDGRRQEVLRMDWAALKASVAQCVACPLHQNRTQSVFGVGDERADWLFVGEGPGAEEDAKGEPFVGQAGRLLDNMLSAIDLARGSNVYIANVVKCRPPGNRNPDGREMSCCEPYLARQIALIQPKLIVALGKTAAGHLLDTGASIASLRGRLHDFQGTPLIVTYHPAYLLRTLQDKAKSWADLCFARETMSTLRTRAAAG